MKNNNFDFLRFYYAFVVVIAHLIVISGVSAFQSFKPFFNSYTSVTAFFCISGFLITRSYTQTSSLKLYFSKRAARLLPAYLLVIILSVVLLAFLSSYSMSDYYTHPQLFKYILSNLTFQNFIEPGLPGVFANSDLTPDVNGALWTLKVEVGFYLLVPVLIYFIRKVKRKYLLLVSIYVLSVLYKIGMEYLFQVFGNQFYSTLAHQIPGFMSYFVCGIALNYYFDYFIKYKKWLFVIGLCIFNLECYMGLEIFTPIALSFIVFAVAFSLKKLNSFGKYGDISYGIYIFHCPIIKTVCFFGLFNKYNPFLVAAIVVSCVVLVGFASWHFVEKGFLRRTHSVRV